MRRWFLTYVCLLIVSIFLFAAAPYVHADSLTATVRIILEGEEGEGGGSGTTSTPTGRAGSYSPTTTIITPVDDVPPQFIFPLPDQKRTNSFFDATGKVQLISQGDTDAIVEWYSDEEVSFSFSYGLGMSYEKANYTSISYGKTLAVNLISLVPTSVYNFFITITDRSNNSAILKGNFTWPEPVKEVVPDEPTVEEKKEEILEPEHKVEPEKTPDPEKQNSEEKEDKQDVPKESEPINPETPPSLIDDIRKIVQELFPAEPQKQVTDAGLSGQTGTGEKTNVLLRQDGGISSVGNLALNIDLVQIISTTFIPSEMHQAATIFASAFIEPLSPAIMSVKNLVAAIEIPSAQVFLMPNVINRGFSVIDMAVSLVRQSLSEELSVCRLVGIDGPVEVVVYELFQFLLCK